MADGGTPAAALKAAQRVMKEWIEVAKKLKRPIPRPRGRLMYA
jgi:predicted RNase H-like HicB family nuclease